MPVKLNMDICLPRGSKSNVLKNGQFSSLSATWIMSWNAKAPILMPQNSGGQHFHSSKLIKIIFNWAHRPDSSLVWPRQPLEHLQTGNASPSRILHARNLIGVLWAPFSQSSIFLLPSSFAGLLTGPLRYIPFPRDSGWFLLQCRQATISHSQNFSGPLFSPIQLVQRLYNDISIGSTVSSWVSNNKKTYHLHNLRKKKKKERIMICISTQ